MNTILYLHKKFKLEHSTLLPIEFLQQELLISKTQALRIIEDHTGRQGVKEIRFDLFCNIVDNFLSENSE